MSKRVQRTFQMDESSQQLLDTERQRRIMAGVPRSMATLSNLVNLAVAEWAWNLNKARRKKR